MASIGHRVGLFDAMRELPPSTPEEIAHKAGLNDRYVREWLGAMVTSGVVELEPESNRFRLPPEHAAFLTRAAAADNMAVFAQYIPVLGSVEEDILACFRGGGGVPYSRFPRFHDVMGEDSGQSVMSSLESHVVPLVEGLAQRLAAGIAILDLGCGSGRIVNRLAEHYPKSSFHGIDLSSEAIERAMAEASEKGVTNVTFTAADLSDFDERADPERYDLVTTFDAVHDQARPANLLKGIHRTLKPEGVYLMQGHPRVERRGGQHRPSRSCSGGRTRCTGTSRCVSLAQGGEGLGAMWGEEKTRDYLRAAGFRSVVTRTLAHDIQNNWYVVRK